MNKNKIKRLLKYIQIFCGFSQKDSWIFFFRLLYELKVFDLPNKHQKIIINNLLLFFEELIRNRNEPKNYKKSNPHLSRQEIINHVICKVKIMIDYPKPKF